MISLGLLVLLVIVALAAL
ncbi:hypothetical protein [Microbacterium sp. Se63.02b]|nr:hypothetical protein [Microbacterium sp. Se63.02b]